MAKPCFEPRRAVEIMSPGYGSGYRIGGHLVLTAGHLVRNAPNRMCKVRATHDFGEVEAQVRWMACGADIALVQLPNSVPPCDAVQFGRLPASGHSTAILPFDVYGWPQWAQTTREGERPKAGGRHIVGKLYLADTSPEGLLVIEPKRGPEAPAPQAQGSEWVGISGAAVVCEGLVVAVQHHHQNTRRAASLEAESLIKVYENTRWQALLKEHVIPAAPRALLEEFSATRQAYCEQVIELIAAKLKGLDNTLLLSIAAEIRQIGGEQTSGIDLNKHLERLAEHIATCLVKHEAVTDVVACLLYLGRKMPPSVARQFADIIDALLPLNYAPDVIEQLRAQITTNRFGLIEERVIAATLAEIIMAGYDQKHAIFEARSANGVGWRGPTALEYFQPPEDGWENIESESLNLLQAVHHFLYDLLQRLGRLPAQTKLPQNETDLHKAIDDYVGRLQSILRAKTKSYRRTVYCVLQMPEDPQQREFHTRMLQDIGRRLSQEAAFVFVELASRQHDTRESEVLEYVEDIQQHFRLHVLQTA